MRTPCRASWLAAMFALQTACNAEESPAALNGAMATLDEMAATVPRVQLVEELRLDAHREDFSSVSRLYVGPRDQIVVPLPQDLQVRIYDMAGTPTASVGRPGGGPGEFQSLSTIGSVADTLWIYDVQQRRLTFVEPGGTVLRTVAVPEQVLRDTARNVIGKILFFAPLAVYGNGSMLGETRTLDDGDRRVSPRAAALLVTDSDAKLLFYPPSYEDPRWMMEVAGFGRPVPFTMRPQMSWTADGRRLATLYTEAATDRGGILQLAVYDIADASALAARTSLLQPVLERSIAYVGEPVPQAAVDSALAAFLPRSGRPTEGPPDLPRRFQAEARARMPSVYPAVARLRLGRDDTIWLDLRPSGDGKLSVILDGHGQVVGTALVPANVTIWQSDRLHVWALERDEFGLASVLRYRIEGLK